VGASALFGGGSICRARRAMLVVDPPVEWTSPLLALSGVRETPYASDQALMYYPWIQAYDRLRGRFEQFPPGAAALGVLARLAAAREPWSASGMMRGR
jgi:phage tail sheath protein FI